MSGEDVARLLREARASQEMTLEQVGRAVGVTRQAVQRWEVGITYPAKRFRGRISEVLGVSVPAPAREAQRAARACALRKSVKPVPRDGALGRPPLPAVTHAGAMLREARYGAGMTIESVAEQIGASVTAVSSWERGVTIPRPERREALMRLLDVPVDAWEQV